MKNWAKIKTVVKKQAERKQGNWFTKSWIRLSCWKNATYSDLQQLCLFFRLLTIFSHHWNCKNSHSHAASWGSTSQSCCHSKQGLLWSHTWSPQVYQHITCGPLEKCRHKLNFFSLTNQPSKSVSTVDYVDRSQWSWILIPRNLLIYYSSQRSNNNKMPLFVLQLKLLMTINFSFFFSLSSKFRLLSTSATIWSKNNSIVTIWGEATLLLIFLFWS